MGGGLKTYRFCMTNFLTSMDSLFIFVLQILGPNIS